MTSPTDVPRFYAEYDRHPGDRTRLFGAISDLVPRAARVLYPGSYVDIGPSAWFDTVTYVDTDKRAARFFSQADAVHRLVADMRDATDRTDSRIAVTFHHLDYREPLPVAEGSIDLLVSLYAGFISESCTRYVRSGGLLLANDSHGDASMASLDPRYRLVGVVQSRGGGYQTDKDDLDAFLVPKRGRPTVGLLHRTMRGTAYTETPYAYIFLAD